MCLPGKAYAAGILLELWIIEPLLGRDGPREGGVFNLRSSLGVGRNILISLLDHSMATDGRRGRGAWREDGAEGSWLRTGSQKLRTSALSRACCCRGLGRGEQGAGSEGERAAAVRVVRGMGKIFLTRSPPINYLGARSLSGLISPPAIGLIGAIQILQWLKVQLSVIYRHPLANTRQSDVPRSHSAASFVLCHFQCSTVHTAKRPLEQLIRLFPTEFHGHGANNCSKHCAQAWGKPWVGQQPRVHSERGVSETGFPFRFFPKNGMSRLCADSTLRG